MTSIELAVIEGRRCRSGDVMTPVEDEDQQKVIQELKRANTLIVTLRRIFDDPNYREGAREHVKSLLETW